MSLHVSHQLFTALSLLGVLALDTACGSSNTAASPNESAGTGGVSSAGGTGGVSSAGGAGGSSSPGGSSAAGGTASDAGTSVCPDFRGSPLDGKAACPGPADTCPVTFGTCGGGICVSCITPVEGMSFARGMGSVRDDSGVTTTNLRNEPSAVCMSGTSVGVALFWLPLGDGVFTPWVGTALGITQLEFTIDSPPSNGVFPIAAILLPDGLTDITTSLTSGGKFLAVTSTSTIRAPLSDYHNPNVTFDPSRLTALGFSISPTEHYDFCVRNLKFLDANNNEVLPPN